MMNTKNTLITAILLAVFLSSPAISQDELLIIAPDEFIDELLPLMRFKEASARPTTLLSLTQVYNLNFQGDEAEQIKRCIALYEQALGIDHVLLVGDVDKFPVRWRWWGRWLPDDPRLTGDWNIVNGQYEQSNDQDKFGFCSWVDVTNRPGYTDEYTIEVDCTPVDGNSTDREVRVFYANADSQEDARSRVAFMPSTSRLIWCENHIDNKQSFNLNQTYHIKIGLMVEKVQVWMGSTMVYDVNVGSYSHVGRGKIGLGTRLCKCRFDNFMVTSKYGTVIWDEDFNDGQADGFTEAPATEERNWMVSDLYYADLYEDGNKTFDDWNWNKDTSGHHEQLYGEIEWDASIRGYCANCTINNDRIDFLPDVALGRIPASTPDEVTGYVNKVIAYELGTRPDDPSSKTMVTYQGTLDRTGVGVGGETPSVRDINDCMTAKGFNVVTRWWDTDLKYYSATARRAIAIQGFNDGPCFINYIGGHGNSNVWSSMNFNTTQIAAGEIVGADTLPIVFSSACFNGKFAHIPPREPYVDIYGSSHPQGKCERFPGPPDSAEYTPPEALQVAYDVNCLAEDLLFKFGNPVGSGGAVACLAERCAGRYGNELAETFYEGCSPAGTDPCTIGEVWKYMIKEYYYNRNLKHYETTSYPVNQSATFDEGHKFDEPQKFILFGDPSLMPGGAFRTALCGNVYDGNGGPLQSSSRYRFNCNVTVPAGQKLTANPGAPVVFESGKKLTAMDASPSNGLVVNGTMAQPVCLLSENVNPQATGACGIRVTGQMRVRNGGAIKMY
jgi:hypothetical protein